VGKDSGIEWTHHTFNPWMGCVEVSPACDHCYARTLVTGRMGLPVWGKDAERRETSLSYWHQPFAWDRAAERDGVRRRVFCGSLCDVMEDRKDLNRIRGDLYKLIESTPHLDWLLLTKRPQNFRRFLPEHWLESPLANVWGMTTVESSEYRWRVAALLETPFAVRGLSVEPLLGPVDLSCVPWPQGWRHPDEISDGIDPLRFNRAKLDWVIVGGESGPVARPMQAEWALALRDQCVAAGVPFFFKQMCDQKGRKFPFESIPPDLQVREFPQNARACF
jgi:protein gp37